MNKQQVLVGLNEADPVARELPHQCRASKSNLRDGISGTSRNLVGGEQEPQYLPRKKHVLIVTSALARGGCERQILATADGLLRRGNQIEIFYFATGEVEFTEEFSRLGIKCRHAFEAAESITRGYDREDVHGLVKFVRLVDRLDVLAIGSALDRAIKEFRPEIVHCWFDLANVIGGLVSTDLRIRFHSAGARISTSPIPVIGLTVIQLRFIHHLLAVWMISVISNLLAQPRAQGGRRASAVRRQSA
jgi:Glycosyltransferase Family 4